MRSEPPSTPPTNSGPVRPVVFLHLPKTAGMTLRGILERVYADHPIEFLTNKGGELRAFASRPLEDRARVALLAGHIPWGAQAVIPGARAITVLRDPVERVISFYHFTRRAPNALHHKAVTEGNLSLADCVESGLLAGEMNLQTAMLASRGARTPEDQLDSAGHNLRAYAAFGLVERFADTVALFTRELRWPAVEWESRNVTENRPRADDLDPALVGRIRREAAFDTVLYNDALTLFERRLGGA